jgi:dephospho-CoA kinase
MKRLGITGSMGCGKSYACKSLLEEADRRSITADYINVDRLRQDVLGTNERYKSLRDSLVEEFGYGIRKEDGSICGRELGQVIFYNAGAMESFRQLTFPAIKDCLEEKVKDKKGLVLVEWAMLAEDGLLELVDYNVLLVTCDYETQLERLKGGDLPEDQIIKRINYQLSNDEKREKIEEEQVKTGKGRLITFDTAHNPLPAEYKRLLEEILR